MQKQGYSVNEEALQYIELTNEWYTNTEKTFHNAKTVAGEEYDLERTNFAKRLCADDANLIEIVEINASKNDSDNNIINDILNQNNFIKMYRKQIEQMSANGTVGAYIRVEDADIYEDNTFRNGKIKIEYCDSLNIVPLTVLNNNIVECAFTGNDIENQKKIYTLVMFTLKDDIYYARSYYLDEYGKEIVERTQVVQLADVKPFAIMRTAENNNLKMGGYGYPKLWSAIPSLKTVDLTMTMWNRDLMKSDKIVLINENLCKNEDGKIVPPTKEQRNLFVQLGSQKLPEENSMYQEYNPAVRMGEVVQSLETALSILSLSFGFGTKKYTFEQGRIVTATEYIGENQSAMQEVNKQRAESTEYITDLVKTIAYFYNLTQNANLIIEEVKVDYDDSYVEDKSAVAEAMRNDALSFDIPKLQLWYFMKKYNLTEKEAQQLLDQVEEKDDDTVDEE